MSSTKKQEFLQAVIATREKAKQLKDQLAVATQEKEDAERKLLEHMDLIQEDAFKTSDGLHVVKAAKLRVSMVKGMQPDVLKWVDEECGRPDLIKPSIHSRTLLSFVNGRIQDGEPIPKELINTYFQPELRITK